MFELSLELFYISNIKFNLYMSREKLIEEKYKELTEVDHVLLRPGMWVGSSKSVVKTFYVYNVDTGKMEEHELSFTPAMLKIVDEIISNSCDEFRRKDNLGLTELYVYVDKDNNKVIVRDNGGIPVVKHKEAGVYLPEFIFGRLRTSSNYDDSEDRNVIGTNGVGSSLTNIFSTSFKVTTADKKNKITVEWINNMKDCVNHGKPEKSKEHFTETEFIIDSKHLGGNITDDFVNIVHKRCIDAAFGNSGLKVTFETPVFKETWKFNNFEEYIDLYSNYVNIQDKIKFKNDLAEAYIFPDSSLDIGFVNGAECSKGTHIRSIRTSINNAISEFLIKKDKIKDISPRSVENKYSVFINITVSNPTYVSQTKEELDNDPSEFSKDPSKKWEISDKFLDQVRKSEIVDLVRDWYKKKLAAEDEKTLRKLNKEASKGLKRSDKFIPANSRKKKDKILLIFEGDSAASGFPTTRDPQIHAGYLMRGVPLNPTGMTPIQIMKNDVYNDLVSILGLKFGSEFNIEDLNYGKICIATDADTDGDKICGLLLAFFSNWPELFDNKIICRLVAPIIIASKGKEDKYYYTIEEYEKDAKNLKNYQIKYTKGLGGQSHSQYKKMLREPIYLYFDYDDQAETMLKRWFGDDSNQRKQLMEE